MIHASAQTTDCTPASIDSALIFIFKGDVGSDKTNDYASLHNLKKIFFAR